MSEILTPDERTTWKRGAKILRRMVPALKVELAADGTRIGPSETRSEAYAIAKANRHKPWARRYLRSIGRLNGY